MIEVKRNIIFFNGTRMTRILRISADFLFNPYRVNDHICYRLYNHLCPTGNIFFSYRPTVL